MSQCQVEGCNKDYTDIDYIHVSAQKYTLNTQVNTCKEHSKLEDNEKAIRCGLIPKTTKLNTKQ